MKHLYLIYKNAKLEQTCLPGTTNTTWISKLNRHILFRVSDATEIIEPLCHSN